MGIADGKSRRAHSRCASMALPYTDGFRRRQDVAQA
jgi:hypothetical protein